MRTADHAGAFTLLRHFVRDEYREYDRLRTEFDADAWRQFGVLLAAVFCTSVRSRIAPGDTAGIVREVAEARIGLVSTGFDIDPGFGEALIRCAVSGESGELDTRSPVALVETEMLLTRHHLRAMTDTEIDALFTESAALAQQAGVTPAPEGRAGVERR